MLTRLKGAIFFPIGLVLIAAAGFAGTGARQFIARTERSPGIVIREEYGATHVDIRFTTRAGRTLVFFQNGEIWQHAGDRVMVRYDPRDPSGSCSLDTFGALFGTTLALGSMGAVLAAAGGAMLFRRGDVAMADSLRA